MLFRRVAVHFKVFPAITKIGFKAIKYYQPAFVYQAIAFRWFVVVFMNFGQTVGKVEFLMINRVIEGQINQFQF